MSGPEFVFPLSEFQNNIDSPEHGRVYKKICSKGNYCNRIQVYWNNNNPTKLLKRESQRSMMGQLYFPCVCGLRHLGLGGRFLLLLFVPSFCVCILVGMKKSHTELT